MINGAHFLLYSKAPDADRAFFQEILNLRAVDAGGGWLIFKLPPAELGVHPADANFVQRHADHDLMGAVLYLMCDDIRAAVNTMESKNVKCTPIAAAEWGLFTVLQLPSGGKIGLYQPSHRTAI